MLGREYVRGRVSGARARGRNVPTSDALGVQRRTLLVCQDGAVTSGIQLEVPASLRNSAYLIVDGTPPLALAVQEMEVPQGDVDGLPVPLTVRGAGATIWTGPAL